VVLDGRHLAKIGRAQGKIVFIRKLPLPWGERVRVRGGIRKTFWQRV
jgi:hypothetical protein